MLKKRIIQEKVEIVMIQETKCDRTSMEKLTKKIWKGCEVEAVDSEGASGGLEILYGTLRNGLWSHLSSPQESSQ
jgi:hypothetical protein